MCQNSSSGFPVFTCVVALHVILLVPLTIVYRGKYRKHRLRYDLEMFVEHGYMNSKFNRNVPQVCQGEASDFMLLIPSFVLFVVCLVIIYFAN